MQTCNKSIFVLFENKCFQFSYNFNMVDIGDFTPINKCLLSPQLFLGVERGPDAKMFGNLWFKQNRSSSEEAPFT